MEMALYYRWSVFILLSVGLVLLMKHGMLTPFVFWSRIQYYTFSTFTLFFLWLGATLFKADIPYLYTADCRFIVAASLVTLSVMYHVIVRPGAIKTHRLNDISYEHFSFYNYIFHYFIPVLMVADYLFFVDKTDLHPYIVVLWMIYPALYVVFVYWRAWVTIVTKGRSHLYPYTFMDPRTNDFISITKGCLKVGFQFFLIGLAVYAAGAGLWYLGLPPLSWTYNG